MGCCSPFTVHPQFPLIPLRPSKSRVNPLIKSLLESLGRQKGNKELVQLGDLSGSQTSRLSGALGLSPSPRGSGQSQDHLLSFPAAWGAFASQEDQPPGSNTTFPPTGTSSLQPRETGKQPKFYATCILFLLFSLRQHFPEASISTGLREEALRFRVKRPGVESCLCSTPAVWPPRSHFTHRSGPQFPHPYSGDDMGLSRSGWEDPVKAEGKSCCV